MARACPSRRRDVIVRRMLPAGHPILSIVRDLAKDYSSGSPGGTRGLRPLLAYLRDVGCDPLKATTDVLAEWVASRPVGRSGRVATVRRLYRRLYREGMIADDPSVGLHWNTETIHAERRFSDDEVRRLIRLALRATEKEATRLAGRRDVVLFLLFAWQPLPHEEVRRLLWSDVRLSADGGSIRLEDHWTVMPSALATAVRAFRADLASYGAEPVDDDALLPALGKRIEVSWRGPDRPLTAPLDRSGLLQAIGKRFRSAGLARPVSTRRLCMSIWLYRDGRPFEPWTPRTSPVLGRRVATTPLRFARDPEAEQDGDGTGAEVA